MKEKIMLKKVDCPDEIIEMLMNEYMGFVYSIVHKKLNTVATKEDVEETVSDVFVKLYNNVRSFDPEKSSLKTFIAVVARNTATDRYRQLVKERMILADGELNDDVAAEGKDLCEDVAEKEERVLLLRTLMEMKEPDRTIVFRHFYLEEKVGVIAKNIGYTPNAVQKRLKRALEKLKKQLDGGNYGKSNKKSFK